ncbi:MAG: FtsX-like permease family protein [Planctomycetota bacterium]
MNLASYVLASLWQYRRSHLAVALGVAVATAVLTGALLVGDSVRGSLADLSRQRLGRIELAVVASQPFRAELADDLASAEGFADAFGAVDAAMLLRGSVSSGSGRNKRLAGGVQMVGITPRFGEHGDAAWASELTGDGAAITQAVADELGVEPGDEVVLRLPGADPLPGDSPLGEKVDTTVGARVTVSKVLPPEGLARFAVAPSQAPPRSVFLPLERVQELLETPGRANLLLVDSPESPTAAANQDRSELLESLLAPRLTDYGMSLEAVGEGVLQLESDRLVLPDTAVDAAQALGEAGDVQLMSTYLANTIAIGDRSISYATVAGVDSLPVVGPLLTESGEPIVLGEGEVVLNDSAAKRLDAKPGDGVTITYYQPESTHGELVTAPPLRLVLRAIVPLADADGRPTKAADPRLTPVLEGVTDADSIDDWDLPFELVEPITQADEDYWDAHSTTPKAFVSPSLARRLWETRWGSVSLLRFANASADEQALAASLRQKLKPADLGLTVLPLKWQAEQAARGTTPFDGLFFGFSMFLIASSVMLIALLFGLGVESRSRELGLLSALGWTAGRVRTALVAEAAFVSLDAAVLGVLLGVGYAGLMIWGLTTLWVDAIVTPFLTLHITWLSLGIGFLAGVLVAVGVAWWVVGRILKTPPRALLAGSVTPPAGRSAGSWAARLRWVLPLLAIGLPLASLGGSGSAETQAGLFFGGGAALLAWLLIEVRRGLARSQIRKPAPARFGLASLAARNAARNRGRSVLTIGLTAAASFLILAISAFRLAPTEQGTGGFLLTATAAQPVHYDLNTPDGRLELGFSARDEELLDRCDVYALRVHDGEDASCLNLYQTSQPRVLGVPDRLLQRGGFAFAAAADADRPWQPLTDAAAEPTPVALDYNTAMYSLKLYGGIGSQLTIRDAADNETPLTVAGLLKNSILQGDLLLGEAAFLELFPEASGSRFFLIAPRDGSAPPTSDQVDELATMLESQLSDYGLDAERSDRRLARFLAVQNTYLSTFQTLGTLGLLLGVVGVAVVQLRNLTERRAELALLRAGGFSPSRLRRLVAIENLLLLGGGLGVGAVAAALALLPQTLGASAADASLPWAATALMLAGVLATGMVIGGVATRLAAAGPIVPALRGD